METKICSATYLERSVLGLGKSLNDNAGEDFAERYNDSVDNAPADRCGDLCGDLLGDLTGLSPGDDG